MSARKFATLGVMLIVVVIVFIWQHHLIIGMQQENQSLRLRIQRITTMSKELSRPLIETSSPQAVSDEHLRELIKLRGEITALRRHRDDLFKQLAAKTTPPPTQLTPIDRAWMDEVLNGTPRSQGVAAGSLRGKLLRPELTNVSPTELALRDELVKRQLNEKLEISPASFADFQTSFIQNALNISNEVRIQQIHDLIQRTYEQAVANGLNVSSKPVSGTDEWVERRFALDRAATAQLKMLLTPEESVMFDRAFLGVMGIDLGGVGVDKSNYPKLFRRAMKRLPP